MVSEEIRNFVQQLLNDKLAAFSGRFSNLERELEKFKTKFYSSEQDLKQQASSLMSAFFDIQTKFNLIQKDIETSKSSANSILDQTDKKLKEIEKIKQNQETSLANLIKSKPKPEQVSVIERSQIQYQPIFSAISSQQFQPSQYTLQNIQSTAQTQQFGGYLQGVFKTVNGKKFHSAGCEWIKHSQIPLTRQQAMKEGLSACLVCKP